jgi:hypothetical protein
MKKYFIRYVVAVVLVVCFLAASPVYGRMLEPDAERAQSASAGEIVGDFLLIRPIMLGATIIGAGVFIVSSPFTLIGRNFTQSAKVLVAEPAMCTFGYPLGSY